MDDSFDNRSIASASFCNPNFRIKESNTPSRSYNCRVLLAHVNMKFNLKIQFIQKLGNGIHGEVIMANVTPIYSDETPAMICPTIMAIKKIELKNRKIRMEETMLRKLENMHPNIISLKYYFFKENCNKIYEYLIMEYMREDMSVMVERLAAKAIQLEENIVKSFSRQMLSALEYLHSLHIAHRDIKPQNILVNMNSFVLKIADFGSAKEITPGNKHSTSVGSPSYRAPEILSMNENYGVSADIWSAACVIAYMIKQKPLFQCEDEDYLAAIFEIIGHPTVTTSDTVFLHNDPTSIGILHEIIEIEDLRSLLMLMFNYNYQERISAQEAYKHFGLINK